MRKSKYIFESQADLSKPKKTVYDVIFRKNYNGSERDIPFGDLPKDLQDTDIIEYHSEESFYSENNSYDAYTEIIIRRPRLETDEEHRERLEESQKFMEDLRDRRVIKNVKKVNKYIIVTRHGKPHKIPVDFEIDSTGDYDVVSKAIDLASKKAGKSDISLKK